MSAEFTLGETILDTELRHINFFNGRLLSGEDLTAEQTTNLAEVHHLGLAIGAGVAFGLEPSIALSSSLADVQLKVTAGLAVNARGQALRLACDQILSLLKPPSPETQADCVFMDCSLLPGSSSLSDDGFYLLTIAPASQQEGLAPVSGLGNGAAPCNSNYLTEGVQFRLVPLSPNIINPKRARNELAYQCFGLPGRAAPQFVSDALQDASAVAYGWETLAVAGSLTSQDVPLAVLQWSANGGLSFLDRWSVRRRLVRPPAADSWGYFTDYRRRAEAEAIFQQFQEQLYDIQNTPNTNLAAIAAEQQFAYLPSGGLLPIGNGGFDWNAFLGAHRPKKAIPLDVEQARALLWRALAENPVAVISASAAANAQPPPVPFRVYQLNGINNLVLFVRSSLNEVTAADVYYDNSCCQLNDADTVQGALDALCGAKNGCCTLTAKPGAGWEQIFNQVPANGNASICFPVGSYPLSGAVTVSGKGDLQLHGCGFGSLISAPSAEAAIIFKGCSSVSVSQLAAECGAVGSQGALDNLNGVLTFLDCDSVRVDEARLVCAAGAATAATCLTVRNVAPAAASGPPTSEARLCRCELLVGGGQIGALFINLARTYVEDNVVRAQGKPPLGQIVRGARIFTALKRQLMTPFLALKTRAKTVKKTKSNKAMAPATTTANASVTYNGVTAQFNTDPSLIASSPADNEWQTAIDKLQPAGIQNIADLQQYLGKLSDQVLATRGRVPNYNSTAFATLAKSFGKQPAVASGGIWVGGSIAPEVRVLNNSIHDVLAGIHIGLSHRDSRLQVREAFIPTPDMAEMVSVVGNRIEVRPFVGATGQRHGIFVGNVVALEIENNYITCVPVTADAKGIGAEGIRVWGFLGRFSQGVSRDGREAPGAPVNGRIIIRANYMFGFTQSGINFNPLNSSLKGQALRPWIIAENQAEGSATAVQFPSLLGAYITQANNTL